jgi:hypothetical protein
LERNPIIKLKVLDTTSSASLNVTFRLEESYDFLQLDDRTGELKFLQEQWVKSSMSEAYNLVVTAEKVNGVEARMTLDLHVVKVVDANEFCERFMCFYESVTYHTFEDYGESFKAHDVGEIYPKFYGKLCKMFDVHYELLNCEFI